jgi:hypothetical protein
MTTEVASRSRPLPRAQVFGGLIVAVLSVGAWFAWMGWDHQYQIDPRTQEASGPYEAWQVVGCVGSLLVLLVTALLLRVRWVIAAPAMTVAFTAAWTATAASTDDTGLYGVGMILLLLGLAAGTTVVSMVVLGPRQLRAHSSLTLEDR